MSGAFVKKANANLVSQTSPVNISFAPTNPGDALIIGIGSGSGVTAPAFADNGVGSTAYTNEFAYANINPAAIDGGLSFAGIWLCPSVGTGVTTITLTWTGGSTENVDYFIMEYSGLATTLGAILAAKQSNIQATPGTTANAITSGTATSVGSAPFMLIGIVGNNGDSDTAAGTGFTSRITGSNSWFAEDVRQTATGSYNATATAATHGGTDSYITYMLALAEPAGGDTLMGQAFM